MKGISRYEKYKDDDFDTIIMKINSGTIKCGRYSHLVKVDKKPLKGKEFFKDGKSENQS